MEQAIQLLSVSEIGIKDDNDSRNFENKINLGLEIDLALARLSPKQARIVELIRDGYSYAEIVAKERVTQRTIRKALNAIGDIIKI